LVIRVIRRVVSDLAVHYQYEDDKYGDVKNNKRDDPVEANLGGA
jgi:hypothetical protein